MGNCCRPFGKVKKRQVNKKTITLMAVGLDNSGKTSVIKRLSGEIVGEEVPTVGFSSYEVEHKGCTVTVYDLGGSKQFRNIWTKYYTDVHGIIFVVDSSDLQRIDECRTTLDKVLTHESVSGKPVLLLANKQDVEAAMDEIDVVERLDVEPLVNRQKCPTLVELCSTRVSAGKMDVGLENGFKWLIRSISKDYPSLNNRVLLDQARVAELERLESVARQERIKKIREERDQYEVRTVQVQNQDLDVGDPFRPISQVVAEKRPLQNGTVHEAAIPGGVEEEGVVGGSPPPPKRVSNLMRYHKKSESDEDLIKNMEMVDDAEQTRRNFLVRPKSSGARLYGHRSDWGNTRRKGRKMKKSNKTSPSPFTDLTVSHTIPKVFDPTYHTDVVTFDKNPAEPVAEEEVPPAEPANKETTVEINRHIAGDLDNYKNKNNENISPRFELFTIKRETSKSVPNSRRNSAREIRRKSVVGGLLPPLPPLRINRPSGDGLILSVSQLDSISNL